MRCSFLLIAAGLGLAIPSVAESAQPLTAAITTLPSAAEVLTHYVRALGGAAAITRHDSRVSVTEYRTTRRPGVFKSVNYDRPFKSRSLTTAPDGTESSGGYDGDRSWSYDAEHGLSFDQGDAVLSARRDADMYYATRVQDYFISLRTVGIETFGGKRCYHLEGVTNWHTPNNQFYDVDTGLLVGYHFDSAWRGGPGDTIFLVSDYKEFDGTLMPTKFVTIDPKGTGTTTLVSVRNASIPDAVFAPPFVFKPEDHPVACPAGTQPKNGCLAVSGKSDDAASPWSGFARTAYLDGPGPGAPEGCIVVSTRGELDSTRGSLHFTAEGHYCPKVDVAQYRYTLDAAEARQFGLPPHGILDYDGPKGTETYVVSPE